jgi:hypothetical protein
MSEITPERARKKAEDLVRRINDKASSKSEREAAAKGLGKLVAEHALLTSQPAQQVSVAETIQKVRDAAADPNVQATVASAKETVKTAADLFTQISIMVGSARKAASR